MSRIEWSIESCRLLAEVGEEFDRTRPFDGLTIGTGIHLEPKTAVLLLTLQRGGAQVVATGNLNTTQPETVEHLRKAGLTVIGEHTSDPAEQDRYVAEVLAARPDLLLDNGGGLFIRYLDDPYPGLRGGTEETTSGRDRLAPLRARLGMPILVINDSPLKQFAENRHAVGQSILESYLRITNRSTNGRRVTVFGYGPCGEGVAINFRNAHALVSVVEVDPIRRLEALWDGFAVPDRAEALPGADLIVTVTGAEGVLGETDLDLLADGAVVMNGGHLPHEIDVAAMRSSERVASVDQPTEAIETFVLADGRRVHVLADGHMANLAGPRPLGNSIESMDIGFTLQARCLEAIAGGAIGADDCVVPVPAAIDATVAAAFVELANRSR